MNPRISLRAGTRKTAERYTESFSLCASLKCTLAQGVPESRKVHWLDEVFVEACALGACAIFRETLARKGNEADPTQGRLRAAGSCDLKRVHLAGYSKITENRVGHELYCGIDRASTIVRDAHSHSSKLQEFGKTVGRVRIILDQEHRSALRLGSRDILILVTPRLLGERHSNELGTAIANL